MMNMLLEDPVIWLALSFGIFVLAALVFGRKIAAQVLDTEINKIRAQIASAETLKTEAETLVAQYKSNLQNAQAEADKIINDAKKQAADLQAQGEKQLGETMARREAMLKTRIEQMERSAMDDMRRYAAELAVSATQEIIAQKMTPQASQKLADKSIDNISETLN